MSTSATIAREAAKTIAAVTDAPAAAPAKKAAKKAPAAKPAAKAATKPAPKAASVKKAAGKAKTIPAAFGLSASFRPSAGKALQCHTQAALEYFGLMGKNGKASKRDLRDVMGDTAVNYHLGRTVANFVEADGLISLSERGRFVFAERAQAFNDSDRATVAAYLSVMKTGKPDGKVVKNALGINKLSA